MSCPGRAWECVKCKDRSRVNSCIPQHRIMKSNKFDSSTIFSKHSSRKIPLRAVADKKLSDSQMNYMIDCLLGRRIIALCWTALSSMKLIMKWLYL